MLQAAIRLNRTSRQHRNHIEASTIGAFAQRQTCHSTAAWITQDFPMRVSCSHMLERVEPPHLLLDIQSLKVSYFLAWWVS